MRIRIPEREFNVTSSDAVRAWAWGRPLVLMGVSVALGAVLSWSGAHAEYLELSRQQSGVASHQLRIIDRQDAALGTCKLHLEQLITDIGTRHYAIDGEDPYGRGQDVGPSE